jgi:hypothetical protein
MPEIYIKPKNITECVTHDQKMYAMMNMKENLCLNLYSSESKKLDHITIPDFLFGKLLFLKFNETKLSNIKELKLVLNDDIQNQYIFDLNKSLMINDQNTLCVHFTNAFNIDISNPDKLKKILDNENKQHNEIYSVNDIVLPKLRFLELKVLDHIIFNNTNTYLKITTYDESIDDDIEVFIIGQNAVRQLHECMCLCFTD